MDTVQKVKQGLGAGAAAGKDSVGDWVLAMALSPPGIALIVCAVAVGLWRSRA